MKLRLVTFLALSTALFSGCAHRPVLPETSDVKVTRSAADKSCKELGMIKGTTISAKGTAEQALEDLKKEAAHKGANYVVIKQYGDNDTSVTGLAYECP